VKHWLITDTHFGHDYMHEACGRPLGFADRILRNLSAQVGPEDVLVHLGDVCIGNDDMWHNRLVASVQTDNLWLVRGNHDRKSNSWYYARGWKIVAESITLDMYAHDLILSHRPMKEVPEGSLNIHGHLHNTGHHPECASGSRHRLLYVEHHYRAQELRTIVEQPHKINKH